MPATEDVPPLNSIVPAPLTFEPASNVWADAKRKIAPVAALNSPVLLPLLPTPETLRSKRPAWTSTVPVLLTGTNEVDPVATVPSDFLSRPALLMALLLAAPNPASDFKSMTPVDWFSRMAPELNEIPVVPEMLIVPALCRFFCNVWAITLPEMVNVTPLDNVTVPAPLIAPASQVPAVVIVILPVPAKVPLVKVRVPRSNWPFAVSVAALEFICSTVRSDAAVIVKAPPLWINVPGP